MDRLYRDPSERTPLLDFDFPNQHLRLAGESYPEDTAAFFGPIIKALDSYLFRPDTAAVVFDLQMVYFNSSSAKALMNMFQLLEAAAERGVAVEINWYYYADDDTMLEFGEDFAEDFRHARFHLHECTPVADSTHE